MNEKIKCENSKLNDLKKSCNKGKEYRATKREIKNLKKERREICKCYEKQFKVILFGNKYLLKNLFWELTQIIDL